MPRRSLRAARRNSCWSTTPASLPVRIAPETARSVRRCRSRRGCRPAFQAMPQLLPGPEEEDGDVLRREAELPADILAGDFVQQPQPHHGALHVGKRCDAGEHQGMPLGS